MDSIEFHGNNRVASSDIAARLATTDSARFLGLFQGMVFDYELFDWHVLALDLRRVERFYNARGYYEARVRAGRTRYVTEDHVQVTIEIEEGPPMLIGSLKMLGIAALSGVEKEDVLAAMSQKLWSGMLLDEDELAKAERYILRALTDRGYAYAAVTRRADLDHCGHAADVTLTVAAGPKAILGEVTVQGLANLPEPPVQRALALGAGQPFSTAAIQLAQQAVLDLRTFSSVEIIPVLPVPPTAHPRVPLRVAVREQPLHSVLLGAGIGIDPIKAEGHLLLGWEHKSLLGSFQHLTIDWRPGVAVYPTRLPTFPEPTDALPEEWLRAELRLPGLLEARTFGVLRQELNVYPVLLSTDVAPAAPILGYLEYKGTVGLERMFQRFFASPTYNFQLNEPFTYKGLRDPDLTGIIISYVGLSTHLDLRNDPIRPHHGAYFRNDVQVAGLGGDAQDLRIQPEIRGYLPIGKEVTVASRVTFGFLFPFNYGERSAWDPAGTAATERAAWVKDSQLLFLRGFFSGGPTSNRGYPLRGVGPHGAIPFFSPNLAAQAISSSCQQPLSPANLMRCSLPLGGLSLWEASLEVRFPIKGAFSGAAFCDTSDVSPHEGDLRFDHLHLSCGVGARYDTPIGPLRLDVGYRVPGLQVLGGADSRLEGEPPTIFGAPIAFSFGIGEAP